MKFYNTEKRSTASVFANENLNRHNFLNALYSELEYEGVLGVSGRLARNIFSGLDACIVYKNNYIPDYATRIKYIQEINRTIGIYN